VKFFRGSSFASTTKKKYRSQLNRYLTFCTDFGVIPLPASQDTLVSYMAFLARSLSASSIPGYMNVIRLLHLEAGFVNPLEGNWDLKMVYKGVLRQIGRPPQQKSPMTATILIKLLSTLEDNPFDRAFWCGCLIAYYGFLRKSSLLPVSNVLVKDKYIARSDVSNVTLNSFSVAIKSSKTVQFGQRVHIVQYAACIDSRLCPVRALFSHFGKSPLPSHSPLFNYREGNVELFMTHAVFMKKLKTKLCAAGENPLLISCHSFRRGGATLAFAAGLSALEIKTRGDWASNAFERYVHVSPSTALNVARTLTLAAVDSLY
jgi:integrase